MRALLLLAGLLASGALTPDTHAAGGPPGLQCVTGPVQVSYGGTPWLVYSCSDGQSLVIVSAPGSPAAPFYFVIQPKGGGYELSSEGTGAKALTDAALVDIQKFSPADVARLMGETRQIKPSAPVSADPLRAQLIGHWTYTDKSGANDLYFGEDGSFSGTLKQGGKVLWNFGGNWTLEGGHITYTYTFSNPHPEKVGMIDIFTVQGMSKDCFTLISATTQVYRPCRAP